MPRGEEVVVSTAPLERLAVSVRRLIDTTVSVAAPPAALERAADTIERIVAELAGFVPSPLPPRYPGVPASGALQDYFPYDVVFGRLNPLAPPVTVEWHEPRAIGRVRLGTPYEGPPGCVHGAVVAAVFDQVLNAANLMCGTPGPTASLEVRYRRPTPLHVDLCFEGWQERVEGRNVHAAGRLLADGRVTAEATGRFVLLAPEDVLRMLERRGS